MGKTKKLSFVFAADDGYIPHLATAVTSLLETNRELVEDIWIIGDTDKTPSREKFLFYLDERYGVRPKEVSIQSNQLDGLFVSGHVSKMTYARFLLGSLLPQDLDVVVYLDSDLVITGPLAGLVECENDWPPNAVVGAVAHDSGHHLVQFGFGGSTYFNAGVLVINLRTWRRLNLERKLIETGRSLYRKLHLWDQDVLNLVLEGRWFELPERYNRTVTKSQRDSASVVHFVGGAKPWMVGCKHPNRRDYDFFRGLTPFSPYIKSGFRRYLFKILVPRSLQKPSRLWKRTRRRVQRLVGRLSA